MRVRRRKQDPRTGLDRKVTQREALLDRIGAVVTGWDDVRVTSTKPGIARE